MAGAGPLAAALESHRAGRVDEADRLYRSAISDDSADPTALYLYGLFNFETGRGDEAADLFERVVVLRPEHAQARLTLAQLRHWRGEHAAAIEGYRQALALAPDRAEAAVGLSNALREAGQAARAIAEGEAAVAQFPRLAEAWMALAAALAVDGRADRAAGAYDAALALDPTRADACVGLASALIAAGDADAAEVAAERAVGLDPASADAWFVRAAALRALFRIDEAVAALERAAKLAPRRAAIALDLGALYAEQGHAPAAEAALQVAVALEPASAAAHASLGAIYLRAGREADAEKHARMAIALDSTLAQPQQTLAAALAAQGWGAEAKRHRDAAYRGRNLFIEPAAAPGLTILMPITAEAGNTPLRDLMPRQSIGRLRWVIEYATPAQMRALPPYDVVFNAIGDVDLAGPTAANMRRFLATCERTVLNPPARIAATRRDRLPALLDGIADVVTPKVVRLSAATIARRGLRAAIERAGVRPPLLVRPAGAHGGRGLERFDTAAALDQARASAGDVYATAFHDYRSADGLYRKYRVIFVDRQPYPYHLAVAPDWLVHYLSAGMEGDDRRRAEEARFLADPEAALGRPAMAAIRAIGTRLDLDYGGLDLAVLGDGRVLVFEANATMLAHREAPDGPFAYKNAAVTAIAGAFERLLTDAAARPSAASA